MDGGMGGFQESRSLSQYQVPLVDQFMQQIGKYGVISEFKIKGS